MTTVIVDDAAVSRRVLSISEDPPEELATLRRAAAGDRHAQAWIVQTLLPGVRRIARALLRSPADADDAAQLAMLAILRSANTYRGEAELEAWARRITARTVFKYLRARRHHDVHVLGGDSLESAGAAPSLPERTHEMLSHDVRAYLDALPEPQREAITLHHALGYTVEEISEITDASPNTVKSRIRIGIASLRKRVQHGGRKAP